MSHDFQNRLLSCPDPRAVRIMTVPEPCPYSVTNFAGTVPFYVHQVWVRVDENDTKPIPENQRKWQEYCERTGNNFKYKLWTEHDMHEIEKILVADNLWDTFLFMKAQRELKSVSDILRFALLHQIGGVYIDCDFPCQVPGPMDAYLPMDRISFICEKYGRNVMQGSAVFVGMNFMAAPPRHPIITRVVRSLPANAVSCAGESDWVKTGPMLLNRCVYGVFSVIAYTSVFGHDLYGDYRDSDDTYLTTPGFLNKVLFP